MDTARRWMRRDAAGIQRGTDFPPSKRRQTQRIRIFGEFSGGGKSVPDCLGLGVR